MSLKRQIKYFNQKAFNAPSSSSKNWKPTLNCFIIIIIIFILCFQVLSMLISGWNGFHNFQKMKLPNSPILPSYHQKLTLNHPTAQGIKSFMWNLCSIIHSQYHLHSFLLMCNFVCVLQFISILIWHSTNPCHHHLHNCCPLRRDSADVQSQLLIGHHSVKRQIFILV